MRFLLRLLGLSSLSLMVVLLLSSDVRNIVILRVNLIKVTSSSYRHQLSPSSRHNRGGANISSESKDVSNWSLSSTFIADMHQHQSNTSWVPFFHRHEGLETVKIPRCCSMSRRSFAAVRRSDVGWSLPPIRCRYRTMRHCEERKKMNIGVGVAEIEMLRVNLNKKLLIARYFSSSYIWLIGASPCNNRP